MAIRLELCFLRNHLDHNFSSNLSHSEFFALNYVATLHSNKGVRILAADKNLGPTIVTDSWYKEKVSRLLSDELFYNRVDVVPFVSIKNTLISILERYGSSIGDKLKSYIVQYADNYYTYSCTLQDSSQGSQLSFSWKTNSCFH